MVRHLFICLVLILFSGSFILFQADEPERGPVEIRILNAESMESPYIGMDEDGIRLIGDVRFSHEGVVMSCDSAHRYSTTNIVHAFGNVHINQGDTLHLFSDNLIYYGNRRFAEARNNVRLEDQETVLTTQILNFDLENDIGFYPDYGVVISGDNRLESIKGYYYTADNIFFFQDSVTITNPDYVISSENIRYNTVSEIAYFIGPTTILGDEIDLYCENGWFNTQTDISQFNENARITNNNQVLSADSIFYDNRAGIGEAFINVEMNDTVENIIIKGNYSWFKREPEEMFVTDSAMFIQMGMNDTLYLHADTLRSHLEIADESDTIRVMVGYYGARFYSRELQGKCDSLFFNMRDSIVFMFGDPVVWSENNQLTAEFIEIYSKNGSPDHMVMRNSAFIVSEEKPRMYNQIRGNDILGYFRENELYRVDVSGNAETLYYPEDGDEIIGVNKASSSRLIIFMKEGKPDRIRFLTQPTATLNPLEKISGDDLYLQGFNWLYEIRPLDPEDIFRK